MKKLLGFFILLLFSLAGYSQSVVNIRGDTVKISKAGGFAELVLLNRTKDTLHGFLQNMGGGRLEFHTIKQGAGCDTCTVGIFTLGDISNIYPTPDSNTILDKGWHRSQVRTGTDSINNIIPDGIDSVLSQNQNLKPSVIRTIKSNGTGELDIDSVSKFIAKTGNASNDNKAQVYLNDSLAQLQAEGTNSGYHLSRILIYPTNIQLQPQGFGTKTDGYVWTLIDHVTGRSDWAAQGIATTLIIPSTLIPFGNGSNVSTTSTKISWTDATNTLFMGESGSQGLLVSSGSLSGAGALYMTGSGHLPGTMKQGTTMVGYNAGNSSITGNLNSGFGTITLGSLTSGSKNSAMGIASFFALTSGSFNTGFGYNAGSSITTGSDNINIGAQKLSSDVNGTTDRTILIGNDSLLVAASKSNVTFIGHAYTTLRSNTATFGQNNQVISLGKGGMSTSAYTALSITAVAGDRYFNTDSTAEVIYDGTNWWKTAKIAFHNIFTPATGGTVTLINNRYNIINPAGTIATLTVNFPPSPANNDRVEVKFTQIVTTVTYAGGTVADGITSPVAGGYTIYVYDSGTTTWY